MVLRALLVHPRVITAFVHYCLVPCCSCTFHAKRKCAGGDACTQSTAAGRSKCPSRACSCGLCSQKPRLECWGTPLEPECAATAPAWCSKLGPVTCPFHYEAMCDEMDLFVDELPNLIRAELAKALTTNLVESRCSVFILYFTFC